MSLLRRALTNLVSIRCCSAVTSSNQLKVNKEMKVVKDEPINRAMIIYKEKAAEQKKFMEDRLIEFDIGKRHLANMMGVAIETFTQDDINEAIEYLLPSGLFDRKSRPNMKHPDEIFQRLKQVEFDNNGRPFHSLFYTGIPAFYQIIQDVSVKMGQLDAILLKQTETALTKAGFIYSTVERVLDLRGTQWLRQNNLSEKILERITDKNYNFFITTMDRFANHPLAAREENFIMSYRERDINAAFKIATISEVSYTELGVPYVKQRIGVRKSKAEVTVFGRGTGKISINGDDLSFFQCHQKREQVLFPLQFTGLLTSVDVVATSLPSPAAWYQPEERTKMGQAYAIRHALSFALRSFVDAPMVEKMRIAGLLTHDRRKRERNKPGRKRSRRRHTWKKR